MLSGRELEAALEKLWFQIAWTFATEKQRREFLKRNPDAERNTERNAKSE